MNKLLIISFFILTIRAIAQPTACFTADVTRGCKPLTVSLSECTNGARDFGAILYNYNDGTGFLNDSVHTFTDAGKYTITQYINTGSGIDSIRKTNFIEVLDTPAPIFEVFKCEGNKIKVFFGNTTYEKYTIEFGDGTGVFNANKLDTVTHIYSSQGNYSLTVNGIYDPGNCGGNSTAQITTLESLFLPQVPSVTILNNTSIQLIFEPSVDLRYEIEMSINGGSFVSVAQYINISATTSVTINQLNTIANEYCFKIKVSDACNNSIYTPNFCPNKISVSAVNNRNLINWNNFNFSTLSKIELLKNNEIYKTYTTTFPNSEIDSIVKCGLNFCYQLVGYTNSNETKLYSEIICVMALSNDTPNTPYLKSVSVENNNNVLYFDIESNAPVKSISIFKDTKPFITIADTNSFTDDNAKVNEQSNCYYIKYTDVCENESVISNTACNMVLKGTKKGPVDYDLIWNAYKEWTEGVKYYELELIDSLQNPYKTFNTSDKLSYNDKQRNNIYQINNYRVKAISNLDNFAYSNVVNIENRGVFKLPNAFTPNNDNLNDTFGPEALYLKKYNLKIYNRWGILIYETTDLKQPWDGENQLSDVYAYVIEAVDQLGQEIKESGTVMLIR